MPIATPILSSSVPAPIYRLRWRFDFANRPTKIGVWNGSSPRTEDSAWAIDKAGLVRAAVEAENTITYEMKTLIEVDGHEYASMQWEAYVRSPSLGLTGSVTPRTHISGLTILTANDRITARVNGTIQRTPLSDHEKKFKLFEHSAGV